MRFFIRIQRGTDAVHLALQIGEGAVLLRERAGRQHDVREPPGLGQEGILADQQLDLLQRFAHARRSRQRGERILAHQVQRLDLAAPAAIEYLHERRAGRGGKRGIPGGSEPGAGRRVRVGRLARQQFGRDAHVHGPLLVGLLGQRVHAAAGLRELAGDPGQVHQIQDIRIAIGLPRHALGAEDHGLRRFRIEPRQLDRRLPRHAGPGRQRVPRQAGHGRLQRGKGVRCGACRGFVHQILLDDGLDQRLDDPLLAPRRNRQRMRRQLGDVGHPGRRDDHLRAVDTKRLLDPQAGDGIGLGDVGADEEQHVGLCDLLVAVHHPPDPGGMLHGPREVQVSVPSAAVHMIGPNGRAHQLLEQVQLLVGAARRDEPRDRAGPVLGLDRRQPPDDDVHRLVPGFRHEPVLRADQRPTQALLAVDVLEAEPPTDAQAPVALGRFRPIAPLVLPGERRGDALDVLPAGLDVHLASVGAVGARARRLLQLPGLVDVLGILVRDGADGADRQAVAAEFAGETLVALGHHVCGALFFEELQRVHHLHVLADVDALAAQDAAVHVEIEDEAAAVLRQALGPGIDEIRHPVLEGRVLQFAMAVGVADRAVERMDREVLFHRLLPGLEQIVPLGPHLQARLGLGGAGAHRRLLALHHHQAHPAGAEGIEGIVVAHGWNDLAGLGDDIVERHARPGLHRLAVNGQLDAGRFDIRGGDRFQRHAITYHTPP